MNILFILANQMHRDALRCMGNPDVQTPNFDSLAHEGILFRNAYSNCPDCTPFCISLLTGLYACQTHATADAAAIPVDCQTLADALEAGGYRTSYVGKWHAASQGRGPVPEDLQGGFADFLGYGCDYSLQDPACFYERDGAARCFDGHPTEVTTDLALERLEMVADEPFALFVSYQAPRFPVQPAPRYTAMYADAAIHSWPSYSEVDIPARPWHPPSLWPPLERLAYHQHSGNLDDYMRLYYAIVTQIDANIGRMLAKLNELNLKDETVVIFTAAHGHLQRHYGMKNVSLPYEESVGIPLIVRIPGGPRGMVTDALVSGVDFYPTLLDYAGLSLERALPGNDFAPLTYGDAQLLNGPVFSELDTWKMVRRSSWKLVVEGKPLDPMYLYNLARDPFELENRVDDPNQSDRVQALRDEILAWQEGAGANTVHAIHTLQHA